MEILAKFGRVLWTDYKTTIALFKAMSLTNIPEECLSNDKKEAWVVVKGQDVPTYTNVTYRLNGSFKTDNKGRTNFTLEGAYLITKPENKKGIISYLSSSLFKGIGPKLAEKIVNKFGMNTLDTIANRPDDLLSVSGITPNRLEAIKEGYKDAIKYQKAAMYLSKFGVSMRSVQRIVDALDIFAVEKIKENPYCLIEYNVANFATCEKINIMQGGDLSSYNRIRACLKISSKNMCSSQGGTYVEDQDLKNYVLKELNKLTTDKTKMVTSEQYDNAFNKMRLAKELVLRSGHYVYPYIFDATERNIAVGLLRLNSCAIDVDENAINEKIAEYVAAQEHPLSTRQQAAVRNALLRRVSVITGGPGTGKTTIIKCIISVFKSVYQKEVVCMAPTGKAARRMSEATGEKASTIHSRLKIIDEFSKIPPEKIEDGLVIIDETSMVDNALMSKIVDALSDDCMLILVGDIDQLPSVGVGQVLNDIINSQEVNTSRLTEVFRQKGGSTIIDNAMKINQGYTDLVYDDNFIFVPVKTEDEAKDKIMEIYEKEVSKWGIDQVALLCPLRRTQMGKHMCTSDGLNPLLKDASNPQKEGDDFVRYENKVFTVGDRVMQWKNKEKSSNGDIGEIIEIIHDEDDGDSCKIFWDNGNEETVAIRDFDTIDYAYAMSIHKSQGSEYNSVIIPMISAQYCQLFKRNLLYTGVTRAKKKVIIVGDTYAINRCIRAQDTAKRKTLLTYRIRYNSEQRVQSLKEGA